MNTFFVNYSCNGGDDDDWSDQQTYGTLVEDEDDQNVIEIPVGVKTYWGFFFNDFCYYASYSSYCSLV